MRLLSRVCLAITAVLACNIAHVWSDDVSAGGRTDKAVLIFVDPAGKVRVEPVDAEAVRLPKAGLLIWPVGDDEERWAVVSPGWKMPLPAAFTAVPKPPPANVRGAGGLDAAGGDTGQLTLQLEQISPDTSTRNVGVYALTPAADGRLLNPQPTFRRLPLKKEPRFPAAVAVLTSENLPKPLPIPFAEGKDRVAWHALPGLPAEVKDGLPAGRYVFGPDKGLEGSFVTFIVEESTDRTQILQPVETLAGLLGKRTDPLLLQFQLEHLLSFRGENDTPLYLSDALDGLESVPEKELTPHLRRQREQLLRCLQAEPGKRGEALVPAAPSGDATGIAELENARRWIASSRWSEALAALDDPGLLKKMAADSRVAGLVLLYRGVILAESGPTRESEARQAFEDALARLDKASPSDRFRAHVNYANFLQRSAGDHVHNHALQMAAGVARPFLATMQAWMLAHAHYQTALQLADQIKTPGQKAAVEVNLARLYALLADVIRTLSADFRSLKDIGSLAGEKAAADTADDLAKAAAKAADADLRVQAIAEEVRALLAFRGRRDVDCQRSARRALSLYLQAGHLAGAENVYRVLGLVAERQGGKEGRAEALKMLQVAQQISEPLRRRFPPGNAGLTRAGFFARKAYVSEKIAMLLLAEDRPAEALQTLELAKARSLQDLLAARNLGADFRSLRDFGSLGPLLAKWPADVAAVEYFLGADRAFVFVVAYDPLKKGGQVTAHPLLSQDGSPVVPRELIGRVRRLLWDMDGQAGKMYQRLVARKGYDNSWQDDLHRLYHELLPAEARKRLEGAKTVVIVPQHILHYFPFAALVTQPDAKAAKRDFRSLKDFGSLHPAQPRFLLDEPFDLVCVPSLLSWRRLPASTARQVWAVGVAELPGAPALEGVKKDLANLQTVFGPSVKGVIDGDNARVSAVRKLLNQRGLLFFGTHGTNLADQPLESHLLLMPDEERASPSETEGHLTAAQLFAHKINADIVVMSACYSGLGDRSPLPGDDLFGLQRAFLQSGVRSVVSGLWDVYDGTAPELMLGMFQALESGKTVPAALAASQRSFLKKLRESGQDEPWLHPYFWAVYTAAGDDRTRFAK